MKESSSVSLKAVLPLTTMAFAMIIAAGCGSQHKIDLAAEESAIRRTDGDWLAAAAAHDLNRALPFWSDDATIIAPGMPPVAGKDAIRKFVSDSLATPGFSITWKTDIVDVAQSGDFAYSTGTDRITLGTPGGKTVTQENRGLVIWKKQPDGSWKCAVDIMSPAAPPNEK